MVILWLFIIQNPSLLRIKYYEKLYTVHDVSINKVIS